MAGTRLRVARTEHFGHPAVRLGLVFSLDAQRRQKVAQHTALLQVDMRVLLSAATKWRQAWHGGVYGSRGRHTKAWAIRANAAPSAIPTLAAPSTCARAEAGVLNGTVDRRNALPVAGTPVGVAHASPASDVLGAGFGARVGVGVACEPSARASCSGVDAAGVALGVGFVTGFSTSLSDPQLDRGV